MKIKLYTAILKFGVWRLTRKLLKMEEELNDIRYRLLDLNKVIKNKDVK